MTLSASSASLARLVSATNTFDGHIYKINQESGYYNRSNELKQLTINEDGNYEIKNQNENYDVIMYGEIIENLLIRVSYPKLFKKFSLKSLVIKIYANVNGETSDKIMELDYNSFLIESLLGRDPIENLNFSFDYKGLPDDITTKIKDYCGSDFYFRKYIKIPYFKNVPLIFVKYLVNVSYDTNTVPNGVQIDLFADSIVVDSPERKNIFSEHFFIEIPREIQSTFQSTFQSNLPITFTIPYNFNYHIKYFLIYSKSGFSNITIQYNIAADNEYFDYEYLNQYLPQKYFNKILPFGYGMFSYAENPLSIKPSGHLSLSRLDKYKIIVHGSISPATIYFVCDGYFFYRGRNFISFFG